MENFKIHFHKTPDDEKEIALEIIESHKDDGLKQIEGEHKKNENEIRAIKIFNELIHKEIKELGLEYNKSVKPDQVHFIDKEIAKKLNVRIGGHDLMYQSIVVDKSFFTKSNKLYDFYATILHEMIHNLSFNALMVQGDIKDVNRYRVGYKSMNPIDSTTNKKSHFHFNSLNEAVTEKLTEEIMDKNKNLLKKELNLSDEVYDKRFYSYRKEIEFLNLILKKVAEFYKTSEEELWIKLKRGLFSGEMMFLRDFEKAMGPGFLREHSK